MPRCGCAGATCTCLVEGGTGITVEGAGSATAPYVITWTGQVDVSDSLQFIDSPTVDFSVAGEGTEANPYQVSAAATVSMVDLTNVDCDIAPAGQTLVSDGEMWQCGLPDMDLDDLGNVSVADAGANEVLTYNATTGQWEPAAVSVEPGQVNTDHGASGDGTASTPVIVQTVSEWNTGELADMGPLGGQTQDGGIPVYIDTLGNVRSPRGLYAVQVPEDTLEVLDIPGTSLLWNDSTILLGGPDQSGIRSLRIARMIDGGTDSSLLRLHSSQANSAGAARLAATQQAADGTFQRGGVLILRADGQLISQGAGADEAYISRPLPFAFTQGTSTHAGGANEGRPVTVTFPSGRFTATPRVFMQVITGTSNAGTTNTETWVSGVTTTAGTLYLNRSNSTTCTAWWFAVQDSVSTPAPLTGELSTLSAGVQTLVGDQVTDDGLATCHTEGCENAEIPIPVPLSYQDWETGELIPMPPGSFQCGVCGQVITDVVPVDGSDDES